MENTGKNREPLDVLILVNGPGELSSYVMPMVQALKQKSSSLRITLIFTPCPYSSGKEMEVAKSIKEIDRVIDASAFVSWALLNKRPPNTPFSKSGIVAYLGGDILYAKMLAKKLKYPAIAYSEAYAKWPKVFRKFLVPDAQIFEKFKKHGFPASQIKIVGNLMADSINIRMNRSEVFSKFGFEKDKALISILPGSRLFQVQFTFKYFAEVARFIRSLNKNVQFAFVISPYLPEKVFKENIGKAGNLKETGISLIKSDQHDVIAASDLVLTIPGTNTAEVAIIGTPMISVFPLTGARFIPLEGIWDIIGRIPVVGFFFKNYYVKMYLSKTRFFAIPNIKSGREIVPDLRGKVTPQEIAELAVKMLGDKESLFKMREDLKVSLGNKGAAMRIAEEIINEALH
jgi:UDP-N-acetylglucosamine:LPS N-acetylglucosamine transferase